MKKFIGLQAKVLTAFSLIMLIAVTGLGILLYMDSTALIKNSIGTQSKNISMDAAKMVDINSLKAVIAKTNEINHDETRRKEIIDMPEYKKIREQLAIVKKTNGVKFVYTMALDSKGKYTYMVDGFPMDYKGDDVSMPGDIEEVFYPEMDKAFKTKRLQLGQLEVDPKWGANVSTYVPILDKDGTLVGLVGTDIEASEIYALLQKNKIDIAGIALIVYLISLVISFYLSKLLVTPLKNLTKTVLEVSDGNMEVTVQVKSHDEIGQLSFAFNHMLSDLNKLISNANHLANHDILTGLSNRRAFENQLAKNIEVAKQTNNYLSVIFIDMDKFKFINDNFGHETGDELLKLVGSRMNEVISNKGISARFGGDEFVILLNTFKTEDEVRNIANQLLKALQPPFAVMIADKEIILDSTPSIGISFYPRDGLTSLELIKSADSAMYSVKQSGKNNFKFYKEGDGSDGEQKGRD
jgi:diguanylate cyclase (GGDEF)-like protein